MSTTFCISSFGPLKKKFSEEENLAIDQNLSLDMKIVLKQFIIKSAVTPTALSCAANVSPPSECNLNSFSVSYSLKSPEKQARNHNAELV